MRRDGTFLAYFLVYTVACCAAIGAADPVYADCTEVGYIATFDVEAGHEKAFESAILALAEKVAAVEHGVVLYAPFRGAEPGRYYMMERYEDEQARQAHAQAPEVRALFPPLMTPTKEP